MPRGSSFNSDFSFCFYDNTFYPIPYFPLVNGIDFCCLVINETIFAYLDVKYKTNNSCVANHLLSFRDLDNGDIYYKDYDYIKCKGTFKLYWSWDYDIVFDNKDDLYKMLYYVI